MGGEAGSHAEGGTRSAWSFGPSVKHTHSRTAKLFSDWEQRGEAEKRTVRRPGKLLIVMSRLSVSSSAFDAVGHSDVRGEMLLLKASL